MVEHVACMAGARRVNRVGARSEGNVGYGNKVLALARPRESSKVSSFPLLVVPVTQVTDHADVKTVSEKDKLVVERTCSV